MNRLRAVLHRTEGVMDAIMQRVAFAALAAMILIITLQIVFRVFFQALSWSEEAARYLLVWLTFLGAAIAFKHGRHIAVTFVVEALPAPLRRGVRALALLASMLFFGVVAVTGCSYMAMQAAQVSASLRLSMGAVYAVIPAASICMLFYAVIDFLDLFADKEQP